MKRVAIFSHYSSTNKIESYVIYFLQELHKFVSDIIFVSDCYLDKNELQKIEPFIIMSIAEQHGEYDFGSYKRGFLYALNNNLLEDCDELVFVNDSCYAPIFSFDEMFNTMSNKKLDFWGVTSNKSFYFSKRQHIQSYFFALNKNVFMSDIFKKFITSVEKQNNKRDIIQHYEVQLTHLLECNNYKWDVYSEYSKTHYGAIILRYDKMLKLKVPFIKRSLLLNKINRPINRTKLREYIINNTTYSWDYILEDMQINNSKQYSLKNYFIYILKIILYYLIFLYDRIVLHIGK